MAMAARLALLAVFAAGALATNVRTNPVFLWSNTNSLINVASSNDVVSFQDLRASVHKVAAAHANSDVLLLLDNSELSRKMGDLIYTELAEASTLKSALLAASSKAVVPHVNADGSLGNLLPRVFQDMKTVNVNSLADAAAIKRSTSSEGTLYIVDVAALNGVADALEALQAKFFADPSAPYIAIYASDAVQHASVNFVKRAERAAGTTRATVSQNGLFQQYTFFTPAIWMGLLVVFVLLFIIITGFYGIASLQTPTQFEKKSLLT